LNDLESEINRRTDARFWAETGLPHGYKISRHNPADTGLIDRWLSIRYEVAQDIGREFADVASVSGASGGPFERMQALIAEHETFWTALAQRHPDAEILRWWMSTRWDPFYADWTSLVTEHGLSDDDVDVLADLLRRLNGLRGEAEAHQIPIPREGKGTAIMSGYPLIGHGGGFHGGGFHGGGFHGFHGGGGWGRGGWGAYPVIEFVDEITDDDAYDDDDDAPTVTVGTARGARFKNSLAELSKVLGPPTKVKIAPDLRGTMLYLKACIDGRCYEGSVDLSLIAHDVLGRLETLHAQWHAAHDVQPLIGAAMPAIDACIGALVDRHQKDLCAGWWHDLTHKVHEAVHEVTHPQELAHDVAHYALHPSDAIRAAAQGLGAGAGFAKVLSYAVDPLQDITESAQAQQLAASMYGGPAGAAALKAAQSLEAGGSVTQTLQALAPQIASAASQVAGAQLGPQAGQLASTLVNAATGTGSMQQVAQQALATAQQAAQNDPTLAAALDTAHQAVAQTPAAYHVAQTVANAAQGDKGAISQVADLANAAAQGDPAAQSAMAVAQSAVNAAQGAAGDAANLAQTVTQTVTQDASSLASAAQDAVSSGAVDLRDAAAHIAARTPARVVGVVFPKENAMQVHTFDSPDLADDWYGQWMAVPHAIEYIAYFDKSDATYPGPLNETGPGATTVSGWFLPFAFGLLGGFAGDRFGPPAYEWARDAWAKRHGKAA